MKALVYRGERKVRIENVPDPRIEKPTDVIVKKYNRHLAQLIHAGRAKPSWLISHELALSEAPEAYQHFDCRDHGWTKVILHPST